MVHNFSTHAHTPPTCSMRGGALARTPGEAVRKPGGNSGRNFRKPCGKLGGNLPGILAGILREFGGNSGGKGRHFVEQALPATVLAEQEFTKNSRRNSRRIPAGIPAEFPRGFPLGFLKFPPNSRQNSRRIPARFPARLRGFPTWLSNRISGADVERFRRRWNYISASHGSIGVRAVGSSSTKLVTKAVTLQM